MPEIKVGLADYPPVESLRVEMVERKGLGHPDYIADAAAEAASRALSKMYLERFGRILHHNLDKVLVVGGQASPRFGGGVLVQPIYILVSGRATVRVRSEEGWEELPVGPIIISGVKNWIKNNFRYLNPEKHVIVDYRIGSGSADLVSVFERKGTAPSANDTSFGVGFWPLSTTERLVLETERLLNSYRVKSEIPAIGEDVKVMGLRIGERIGITVAAAIVSRHVNDMGDYVSVKEEIRERILDNAAKITDLEVSVEVNTADDTTDPSGKGVYLTVTGTSAEHGDDGATGRGNRVNGLITPMRPMSLEAAAGKNPVNHVGKLYNVAATLAARRIVEEVANVEEAYVKLLSQIGRPIDDPWIADAEVRLSSGSPNTVKDDVSGILEDLLGSFEHLTKLIIEGNVSLF